MENQAPYQVVVLATLPPAAPPLLDLRALHARLLPLAVEAGHKRLHLECHYNGQALYEAWAAGGPSGHRNYITWASPVGGRADEFEAALTEQLHAQARFLAAVDARLALAAPAQ